MTSRQMQTTTEFGGSSSVIEKAGTYHVQVLRAKDGQSTKGKPISGCSALLSVLAGTEAGQVDKQFHLTLFDLDPSKSEASQEWATRKQTAYGVAINQIDPSTLGETISVDFDLADGRQFFVTLSENEYNGKTTLQLAFDNIYHLDDPRAKRFPKNKEAMELLPADHRKSAEYFKLLSEDNGNGSVKQEITKSQLEDL